MKHLLSNCMILLFLGMIFTTHLEKKTPVLRWVLAPVYLIQDYLSIHQKWAMFAPNPGRRITKIQAKIQYRDGTFGTFNFPSAGIGTKSVNYSDRLRKYQSVVLANKKYSGLWPDAARWALRKAGESYYSKIPKSITLLKAVKVIPPIKRFFYKHLEEIKWQESFTPFYEMEL